MDTLRDRISLEDLGKWPGPWKVWSRHCILEPSSYLHGHTGFKGSWLLFWLNQLGAQVWGYALEPEGESNLFIKLVDGLNICSFIDQRGDLNDSASLRGGALPT